MKFHTKDYTDVQSLSDEEYICFCKEIDKGTIVSAIENGAITLKKIRITTSACTGSDCETLNPTKKCCSPQINKLIKINKG